MEKRSSNPDNTPLFLSLTFFYEKGGLTYISQVPEMTATRIIINAIFGTSSTIGLSFLIK